MAWWRRDSQTTAEQLYEEARRLCLQPGRGHEAEQAIAAAVTAYRNLLRREEGVSAWRARRGLALALWRYSMLVSLPRKAMALGREGVALSRQVLDAAPPGQADDDELLGETATAMNDLSQLAARAGLREEHLALMRDVVALCEGRPGPRGRQALGTALHNQAVDAANRAAAGADKRRISTTEVSEALEIVGRAINLRREVLDPDRPMTSWELANSMLLRGKLYCLSSMGGQGAADLLIAWRMVEPLQGAASEQLWVEIEAAMRMAAAMYPDVVADLDWPAQPRPTPREATPPQDLMDAMRLMEQGRQREAVTLLTRLADSGSNMAMHVLGLICHQMGQPSEASAWFRRAAEAGNVDSMIMIGCRASEAGRIAEAERWLAAAAATGAPSGLFNYGMLLVQHLGRAEEGKPLWERAAEQGHALAALNLGNVLYTVNRDEAERWFRRGAELGNTQAMINLATMLRESGRGTEADQWYQRSLVNGR